MLILLGPLLICAAILLTTALLRMPLNGCGSAWLLEVLNQRSVMYDHTLLRQADTLLQLPALAVLRVSGQHDWSGLIILSWCLSYTLHPLLSLWACWGICKTLDRRQFFIFPVLSFATATLMTLGNTIGVVPTSLSIFWPVFLMVLLSPMTMRWTCATLAGAIALAFSHEASFMLFLVLVAATLLRSTEKSPHKAVQKVLAIPFLSGALWLAYRAFIQSYGESGDYRRSVGQPWGPFTWGAIAAVCLYFASLIMHEFLPTVSKKRNERALHVGLLFIPWLIYAGYWWHCFNNEMYFAWFYNSRVPAIPLACLVGATALFTYWQEKRITNSPTGLRLPVNFSAASGLIASVLVMGSVQYAITAQHWAIAAKQFQEKINAAPVGCSPTISYREIGTLWRSGVEIYYVPQMSLTFQPTRRPMKILSVRNYVPQSQQREFCSYIAEGRIPDFSTYAILRSDGYSDYSGLISATKAQLSSQTYQKP